ncbi:MAG: hypothetical protein U0270_15425 [Labilithrix sp.]
MKLANIAPVFALVAVGLVSGCAAEASGDSTAADDSALSGGAGVEFTSAVGAVLVDGKKVCTAALVDIDASAKIGPVSASGRQVVFGAACAGKLQNGVGAAVFVSMQNGVSISTPIVAFDFESQASAGLGVAILGKAVPGAEPIEAIGTSALINAGAHVASVIEADENGLLIASSAEIHAGVAFSLKTKCTSFQFAAQAGVAVGGKVSLGDDGLGASAFVKINGKLHFAAHIDAGCVVHQIGDGLHKIGDGVLKGANDVGNFLSSIGTGDVVAVVHTKSRYTTFGVRMTEDTKEIRINGQGYIGASDSKGAKCEKVPLLVIGGPCELSASGGYKKGELVTIKLDTGLNLFPNGDDGQRFTVSTSNDD